MGNTPSLEDELINLKMASRQLIQAQKRCLKSEKKQLSDVKKAIKQGNKEGARIYAQNAIREKTQAMNYLKLSSRVDAVASRLETAIRTKQISNAMSGVVKGMGNALKSMDMDKISKIMDKFEEEDEDMQVVTRTMEQTFDSTTATMTPQEEVDSLIVQVIDENQLEVDETFGDLSTPSGVPTSGDSEKEKVDAAPQDDLAARLEALRG